MLISMIAGGYAIGATLQPDLTRYSRSKRAAASGMVLGMMVGFPAVLAASVMLAAASGQSEFTEIMLSFHSGLWGVFAMAVIVFATWTTNDNNLYSAALAFNALTPSVPKWVLSICGGALGTALALGGVLAQYTDIMMLLGVAIPPVGAVMAVDFLLTRGSPGFSYAQIDSLPTMRWEPFVAWAAGASLGFATYLGALTLTTAPALDGMLAAALVHGLYRSARGGQRQAPPLHPGEISLSTHSDREVSSPSLG